MQRSRRLIILILLIAASAAAGFYANHFFSGHNEKERVASANPVTAHPRRPDFRLPDLDGNLQSIDNWNNQVIMVNFWATWCPPCREEMPELESFHAAHEKDDAVVLGLNTEVIDKQRILDFLDEYFISYPNFIVGPVAESPLGRIPGLPTTFVLNPEGELVARQVGGVTREMIENFIDKWEAKNP